MTTFWQDGIIKRPDRYFDWTAQNDRSTDQDLTGGAQQSERWCSVLIQMKGDTGEELLANLERLQKVFSGDQGADQSTAQGRIRISMNADEHDHLANVIVGLQDELSKARSGNDPCVINSDGVRYQFFVYLPESSAYSKAQYASYKAFWIRHVGPSIERPRLGPLVPADVRTDSDTPGSRQLERTAIGIIDERIAYANERFRFRPDPKNAASDITRISRIWLQGMERDPPDKSVVFGTRFGGDEINRLFCQCRDASGEINETEVYQKSGQIDLSIGADKSRALRIAHGTHIMDLACGYDSDDLKGLEHPIFAVQLPSKTTADNCGSGMETYVLQAVRQIILWADTAEPKLLPLVINFNYCTASGANDGTFYLEREIDRLIKERNERVPTRLVLPAAMSHRSNTTIEMDLPDQLPRQAHWTILPDGKAPSFLEIWLEPGIYDTAVAPIKVVLTPPNASPTLLAMPENGEMKLLKVEDETICGVYYDLFKLSDGRQRPRIFIAVNAPQACNSDVAAASSRCWGVAFVNQTRAAIKLKAYVRRGNSLAGDSGRGRQYYFDHEPGDEWGNVDEAYDHLDPGHAITQDPELSALCHDTSSDITDAAHGGSESLNAAPDFTPLGPSETIAGPIMSPIPEDGPLSPGILAAGTLSGSVIALSGTSVAAPQVTRLLTDMKLDIDSLIQLFGTPVLQDPRLGFGVDPIHRGKQKPTKI